MLPTMFPASPEIWTTLGSIPTQGVLPQRHDRQGGLWKQPVAATVGLGGYGADGVLRWRRSRGRQRTVEDGVAKCEHATIGTCQPVTVTLWSAGHADDRGIQGLGPQGPYERRPAERRRRLRHAATSQYPEDAAAIPTIGALSGLPPMEPSNAALPNAKTPPSDATNQ